MTGRVALCIDELTSNNPGLIGLDGESIGTQKWLSVFSSGREAREGISNGGGFSEAWVLSCEDVEPINLAASIKSDSPDLHTCLVAPDLCGSLLSRAHTALIDEVIEYGAFLRKYADAKRRSGIEPLLADSAAGEGNGAGTGATTSASAALLPPPTPAIEATLVKPEPGQHAQQLTQQKRISTQAASRAFVMPVVSGSGGAGKSAVSTLGALIARRKGYRTLLLDYDLQFGDVAFMAGVEEPLRIDVALTRPDQLEREIRRDDRISIFAAPSRLESAEAVVRSLPDLLERLSGEFDVIVANTGAAWAEQHAALLERSSAALFLVDQRASSVRACKHALELCARCGIASGPFQFALNRCAKGAPLTSVDVSCAIQGAFVFELKDGGRDVEECLSSGAAAELLDMRGEFVKSLEHVMDRLLPGSSRTTEQVESEPERRTLLRRGRRSDKKRR